MVLNISILATMAQDGLAASAARNKAEAQFKIWIKKDLWPEARKQGISAKTFNTAFAGLKLDWSMPEIIPLGSKALPPQKQSQAEFKTPGRYFNNRSMSILAARGKKHLIKWRRTLNKIEKKYGVPRQIIVAIWARESGFGRVKMPKNAVRALATSAFMGWRRELFRRELLAALKIIQAGHISAKSMGSSWAGALGQPQFLPSKFTSLAVDFDGNGRADIWKSVPDTLASIAHYLSQNGWQRGRDWGFEASIPASVACSLGGPDQGQNIVKWQAMGIARSNKKQFPKHEISATGYLLFPAGRHGPVFVTTPNFYVLKTYNESDLYALFVGHLADRIMGGRAFKTAWKPLPKFSRKAVKSMQIRLVKQGYDVGGADGLVGYKTRTAIGLWQGKHQQKQTCYPDKRLVKAIR